MNEKFLVVLASLVGVAGPLVGDEIRKIESETIGKNAGQNTVTRGWFRWAGNDTIFVRKGERQIARLRIGDGKGLHFWKEMEDEIEAFDASSEFVYVGVNASGRESATLFKFGLATGREIGRSELPKRDWTAEELASASGGASEEDVKAESLRLMKTDDRFKPHQHIVDLRWLTEAKTLCLMTTKPGIQLFSEFLEPREKVIPYTGTRPILSDDGQLLTLCKRTGSVVTIDGTSGEMTRWHGPDPAEDMRTIGPAFQSNGFCSADGRIIRVFDGGCWGEGDIFYRNGPGPEVKRSSGLQHAIADVHWPTNRFAIAGNSDWLDVLDTKGDSVLQKREAMPSRAYVVAFSPNGKRLATLGAGGELLVFELN